MRIPVTGAKGYLDRKVTEYLAAGGNDITALVKSGEILNNRLSYTDEHYRKGISHAGFIYHYQSLDYSLYARSPVKAKIYFGLKPIVRD